MVVGGGGGGGGGWCAKSFSTVVLRLGWGFDNIHCDVSHPSR